MTKKQILGGVGAGIAVGAVVTMVMAPKRRHFKHSTAGKAMKAVSQVMDNIADAMGA